MLLFGCFIVLYTITAGGVAKITQVLDEPDFIRQIFFKGIIRKTESRNYKEDSSTIRKTESRNYKEDSSTV